MQMASEMNQEDALAGLSEDELKSQNHKLRQAISSLTMNYEIEKSRLVTKIGELNQRAKLGEELEAKIQEQDLVFEELDIRDKTIAELEARIDEINSQGLEQMVEDMAEEIIKLEEEIA